MSSLKKYLRVFGYGILLIYAAVWAVLTKCNVYANRNIDIVLLTAAMILLVLFLALDYIMQAPKSSDKKGYAFILKTAVFIIFTVLYLTIFYKFDELLQIILSTAIAVFGLVGSFLIKKIKGE